MLRSVLRIALGISALFAMTKTRHMLALTEELKEGHGRIELARGKQLAKLLDATTLRLNERGAVATGRLVFFGLLHFIGRRHMPLGARR